MLAKLADGKKRDISGFLSYVSLTHVPSATECQRERIFSNRSFGNGPASRIATFSWILSGFVVPTMAV